MMSERQNFKLTNKQSEALDLFISLPKNIMLYGGSRSGKTFFTIWSIFMRAARVKSRHCILRAKFSHAINSIWLDTIPKMLNLAMPDLGAVPNKSRYYYTLPNGSEIWVGGLDSKERAEKILGNEYSTMYFNETSQLDYQSISLARTRLAEKNELVKKTYYDSNPPTKSSWQYWLFEKKLNPIDDEPLPNPDDYESLLMNPIDNLDNIDDEYLELLKAMPEAERNRFLYGLYSDSSDGQAYYAFNREDHVKELNVPTAGNAYISMDFNVNPMTACIFKVINGTFYIYDEIFLENSDTFRMVDELKKKKIGGIVIPDSTGKNRKTSGKSDHQILKEAGFRIPSVQNPFVTDRVNNVNRLFSANRIIINPKCKKLINDLEKVSWKDNKLDQKTDSMLTHISDALGYGMWYLDPIGLNTSKVQIGKYR